ncbi:MAG: two-component system, OmpR family, alkaline phosphatase synthesis response regulator PhoP [Pyrinomonadaceae bacterium]|jgi:DNA-binding response OmpR family regulator|nr:two-component system, OmpR family, alkaline phosphatase synthesis response regulator PhoP [Pyrinomonadaceae bacterium]MDQ1729135.1 two-component system, OmpR family, alkaline phosphatase synthesis response regulator PhoP [Pyrinomonadaceae bacterium]
MTAVLVVEDEQHLADGLRFNLEAEGYSVNIVSDGESALALFFEAHQNYDALVLDVMLPGKDGFTVAAELRAAGYFVPVLMLTARGRPEDVLRGFEAGADDYLPKPFELSVLLARLHALLRRRQWFHLDQTHEQTEQLVSDATANEANQDADPKDDGREEFAFKDRVIDFGNLELRMPGQTIRLTLMEAQFLRYLVKHEGNVVSRKAILEDVWGLNEDTDTRAIDNFIVRLRKYLEDDPTKPVHLLTVRGVGYRFVIV